MPLENTDCNLCGHHADQHNVDANGYRPCRSVGHLDGLNCRECMRLTSAEFIEKVMALRHSDDPAFAAAWSAFYLTRDHAKHEIGNGWQAFFTDVHKAALASAVLAYQAHHDPAQRAAVLREAAQDADNAGSAYAARSDHDRAGAAFTLMEKFQAMADNATENGGTAS